MALIDELKERREAVANKLEDAYLSVAHLRADVDDLDRAIAAFEPTTLLDFAAEQETAREQLEREPEEDWTNGGEDHLDAACAELLADEQDDASEFISDLTGDPAIEPESGLHEERPALNPDMQDEREEPVSVALTDPHPADDWVPGIAGQMAAPVTNPEADTLAKAHDWYDPKAVADRERFNPFAMFRRQTEDV